MLQDLTGVQPSACPQRCPALPDPRGRPASAFTPALPPHSLISKVLEKMPPHHPPPAPKTHSVVTLVSSGGSILGISDSFFIILFATGSLVP